MRKNKLELWLIIAIIATIILNIKIGTSGLVLWLSAIASLFNLYFTNKKSKWFIIPDMIWIICMLQIAWGASTMYDLLQYGWFFIIGWVQLYQWSTNSTNGVATVQKFSKKQWIMLPLLFIILIPVMMYLEAQVMKDLNTTSLFIDSLNTSMGLVGSGFIAYRYREAQIMFLISNFSTVILYSPLVRNVPSVSITMLMFGLCTLIALPDWFKK